MSIINSQPLIGASGNQSTAYNLTRSLRFRSSASAYLNRTPASAGNRRTATFSFWIKRGTLSADHAVYSLGAYPTNLFEILFLSDNTLYIQNTPNSTTRDFFFQTTQVFRDPSAWYHIVLQIDTTQATSSNRAKLYINGSQVTAFSTATYPNQNTDLNLGLSTANQIGRRADGNYYQDAYLAEFHHIDGQSLDASSFGETDTATGVWKPKKYTGTYGTNGFYLKFDNLTSTSTLGNDSSGNSNTWTVNNISLTSGATYDSMKDVPTLTDADTANYSVLNPVSNLGNGTISAGNLDFVSTTAAWRSAASTMFVSSGKWYFEGTITAFSGANPSFMLGVCNTSFSSFGSYSGSSANAWVVQGDLSNTKKWNNDVSSTISAGQTSAINDVFMIAVDVDATKVWFGRNGTWYSSGDPAAGTNAAYTNLSGQIGAVVTSIDTLSTMAVNFGQRPFAYTPPSGFKALNTFNLPTPTIGATASTQANKYFDVALWTGNDSATQTISSLSFQPDFVWGKNRSASYFHNLYDAVRGAGSTKQLASNTTGAEGDSGYAGLYGYLSSFNSNGFTATAGTAAGNDKYIWWNDDGASYVAWNWKANGAGSSNTAGTITSTVSANTTAGFSIATYTGNGTGGATFGHGLGVAPSMVIVKNRTDAGSQWIVFHTTLGGTKFLYLDGTDAAQTASGAWNNTAPSSTLVTLGTSSYVNGSTKNYVAYCFAEVAGYSKFGSYTGNGSTDGPFVFTGFRPRYLLVKRTDTTSQWSIWDTARNTINAAGSNLWADSSEAETTSTSYDVDFLSNGFKLRNSNAARNASGGTYIFAAFADTPFKYSLGR